MTALRTLTVNGQRHRVAVEDGDTLLDTLRDKLRLTGAKKGCNVGDCGACTILNDGLAMNSCLLLAADMEGRAITTIEGLANNGEFTALQKAFVAEGGIQCGFCTPGMVFLPRRARRKSQPDGRRNQGSAERKSLSLHRL